MTFAHQHWFVHGVKAQLEPMALDEASSKAKLLVSSYVSKGMAASYPCVSRIAVPIAVYHI